MTNTATKTATKTTGKTPTKGVKATTRATKATATRTAATPKATAKADKSPKGKPAATAPKVSKASKIEDAQALALIAQKEALAKEAKVKDGAIRDGLATVEHGFTMVAFGLHWFKETEGYKELGAKNFAEFAKSAYGIEKRTAYNFCSIVDRFGERDKNGVLTGNIRPAVATYSSSQLLVLLDVDDSDLGEYTPDMSVRAMKDKVKEAKAGTSSAGTSDTGSGDAESDNDGANDCTNSDVIDTTITEVKRQTIITFSTMEEYNAYLDGMTDLIEKNLKSKACKDGGKRIEIALVW